MIDERAALAIARAEAAALGWAFVDPVDCALRRTWLGKPRSWTIRSNSGKKGAIARFSIDANDGRVLEKGYVPR